MAEQKSFWKRYEYLIILAITLLVVYLFVFFNQKINFFLGNELIVYLTPEQNSFAMHYDDVKSASFDLSIDNVAYCKAQCSYSFTDRSTNSKLDNGSFEISKKEHTAKSYNLSVTKLGSGQDIYSFDVKCHSIHSFLCLTEGSEYSRSSLVIVNYDLTETQKELKKILKQNVTELLELLGNVDISHKQLNQKFFELGFKANLQNLSKQKIEIDDNYDKIRLSIENLRSLWSIEDYNKLNHLFNESFSARLYDVQKSISDLNISIDNIIEVNNELLSKLNFLNKNINELNVLIQLEEENETLKKFDSMIKNFSRLASSLINNTFNNYTDAINKTVDITNQLNTLIQQTRIPAATLYFKSEFNSNFGNDILCSLKQDCQKEFSAMNILKNTGEFMLEYPNATALNQSCNSLRALNQSYSNSRDEATNAIKDNNATFPTNNEFFDSANTFEENKIRLINNSYFESFEKTKLDDKINPEAVNIANLTLPKNNTEIVPLSYNKSINISLYVLSKINIPNATRELLSKCSELEHPVENLSEFNFTPINSNLTYKIISNIDTNLSDNPPICCVFKDCKPCCSNESCKSDPKTFPIIFLHGHSFAKDNSPEFSLDSFNKLQEKLQEDGYLNAGIVSLYSQNESLQPGIWGLSGKPVTVKVSYYYDALRKENKYIIIPTKSENIDTYAVRLMELIDIVKERTNKKQVNIVAHSMGGLVARRYIQIFGEENVNKLIMIATPNKGITSEISGYCGYVGENSECQDMDENSLFMNKLNDPLRQPSKVKLYSIIGQGCQMKPGDGDGVVLADKAKLENAYLYYVNGTCGGLFGDTLHTEILNIDKYPETYKIVAKIFRE